MNNDVFVKKFKYVMHQMFPNTNKDFTFNNFDKYIDNPKLNKIGIYVIKPKEGCQIKIIKYPDGPVKDMCEKYIKMKKYSLYESENKLKKSDNEILYIGATPSGEETENLEGRLIKYRNFGFGYPENNLHRGGKRIWFIEDNKKNLVIDFINIDLLETKFTQIYKEAKKIKSNYPHKENLTGYIEDGLLYLHSFAYDSKYPFANEKFDYKETKNAWKAFWTNYEIN